MVSSTFDSHLANWTQPLFELVFGILVLYLYFGCVRVVSILLLGEGQALNASRLAWDGLQSIAFCFPVCGPPLLYDLFSPECPIAAIPGTLFEVIEDR